MEKFVTKVGVYILGIVFLHIFFASYADGNTDDNYRRFTGDAATNIIIGDSRSAQGIVPSVLQNKIKNKKFVNFSFNIVASPYGPIYLESIKKKIKPQTKDGIFILSVNPWSISSTEKITSIEQLPEETLSPLRDMYFYNSDPNYEYLIKHYPKSWYYIYRDRESVARSKTYLHKDGWLEVSVEMDSLQLSKRVKEKVDFYKKLERSRSYNTIRLNSLNETISFLKNHGKVYLVRLPASEGIMEIEERKFANFDSVMLDIANRENIQYFNFSKNYKNYQYTDGNHLYRESSINITRQLSDSIILNR